MRSGIFVSLVAAAIITAGTAVSVETRTFADAPRPSITPVSWELKIQMAGLPQRIYVPINGKDQAFWYQRYTVINNSGSDISFNPNFELVADTGQVLQEYKDSANTVFQKIKQLHNDKFLLSPSNVYGKLLQGEDNAKSGVIIFSDIDTDARKFQLFIAGLSGETAEVKNPVTDKPVILQKTLELDFTLPGQAIGIEPHAKLNSMQWVMK